MALIKPLASFVAGSLSLSVGLIHGPLKGFAESIENTDGFVSHVANRSIRENFHVGSDLTYGYYRTSANVVNEEIINPFSNWVNDKPSAPKSKSNGYPTFS